MMTAEQLKNSILQLAMQGKLVEQRPEEGSGEDLYNTIQAEKKRLVKEGTIKKQKSLPDISYGEVPFDIPDTWKWVHLGDITELIMGQSPKGENVFEGGQGIEFHQGKIYFSDDYLLESTQTTNAPTKIVEPNTVLLCVRAPVGTVNITPRKICIGRGLCGVRVLGGMDSYFMLNWLRAIKERFVKKATGTTFIAITGKVVEEELIPLPPLAEQKRIVTKIEELMPFVEQYATASTKLNTLNASFPEMMKKSILQEAVQGKLVPQDPNDEPASLLLKKDQKKKQKNGRRKDIKKKEVKKILRNDSGEFYEIREGNEYYIQNRIPFDIPQNWEWIHLGYVCDIARGGSPRPIKNYLTEDEDGINWIKIGDSDIGGKYINNTKERIIPEGMKKSRFVQAGDFLLTNSMSFGRPYILNCDGCIHDGWLVLTGYKDVYDKDFLYYMLSSGFAFNQFCDVVSGAVVKNLNSDKVAEAVFPVPPLAEQKRIVSKIEELMLFVEELV